MIKNAIQFTLKELPEFYVGNLLHYYDNNFQLVRSVCILRRLLPANT